MSYHGHSFQVPAVWPVINLQEHPTECVRFDRHAVYLGTPGTTQDCPSHPSERTEALLIEPQAVTGTAAGTTDDPLAAEFEAAAPGIKITATYGDDRPLMQNILRQAGLPSPGVKRPQGLAAAPPIAPRLTAAALPSTITDYTGYGFETCAAPDSGTMNAWMNSSPYRAVGIYIGGARACSQRNLSADWVQQQATAGWHFMPIYVSVKAANINNPVSEGTAAADDAVNQAAALGFSPGSTLYDDMEAYSDPSLAPTVLSYLSAWTKEIHARGYVSGVYSSAASGIADLAQNVTNYTMPDVIWIARYNGDPSTSDPAVPSSLWANHQRIHQYMGDVQNESHGGVSMSIDRDYLDVAASSGQRASNVMRVDTIAAGNVFDDQRNTDGTWSGAALLDGNGGVTQVATAALTDGTFHVQTLAGGKVFDNQRNPDGTWTGANLLDGSGTVTAISSVGLTDGTMHVQTLAGGKVFDNQRNPDGTWTGANLLDGNGTITAVSSARLTDGTMHVQTVVSGNLYDNQRNTDGTWSGANVLDQNGHITAISAAGLADGTMHVQSVVSGNLYDNQRNTDGTWTGANVLNMGGGITAVAAAGLADGTLHVETLSSGDVYDNQRNPDGTWTGANPLDSNGSITAISAAAIAR
ncbi:glycoside hydrolase domain-containing protein [Kitasatospora acidiphila]|uniref:glycoside hydrolase domain-containing protein n=1 Tax=Kitasatospora acidiphila TaxID=2567942 RepID=UPI0015F074EB|nr:glycoside hydrolase domain-containing protein [Kitasatospora acidiphila]